MNVFFTSDLHIGHGFIASLRHLQAAGFADAGMNARLAADPHITEAHDKLLAENWDRTVSKDDTVWVLGDISAGGSSAQVKALEWFQDRPGRKHLVAGNHDGCHPMHRDSHKWQPRYLEAFDSVQAFATRRISTDDSKPATRVMLSHFPYGGDHTPGERFEDYRLREGYAPILHGHLHVAEKISYSELLSKQIHVGVDAWGMTPASLDQIAELLK